MNGAPSNGRGVNVFGYLSAEVGTGELGRLAVRGLHAASVRCAAIDVTLHCSRADEPVPHADAGVPCFSHDLYVVNADQVPVVRAATGATGRPAAGLWAWETERLPMSMVGGFEGLDVVLSISEHSSRAIRDTARAAGLDIEVRTVPVPVVVPGPDHPSRRVTRRELGVPDGPLVAFCFDFLSVVERKNPFAAIEAYRRAVPREGAAHLVIKSINGGLRPEALARVRAAAAGRRDVLVIDEYWDHDRTLALIALADVYLSLHRCEGFGHTIAESMAAGTAVIATRYGGSMELTTDDTAVLVPFTLVDVPDGVAPYSGTGRWAEPDVDAAAGALARLLADPRERAELGAAARAHISATRRLDAFGRAIVDALGWPPTPRLSALVPSSRSWTHASGVVEALLPAVNRLGIEVIAACAGPEAGPPAPLPGVDYVIIDQGDVFDARRVGAARARGEVVAFLEDHSYPPESWASDLLDVWSRNPDADAVVHTIHCSADAGVFERALFTLTFGPFLPPIEGRPLGRLPVPGIVSVRRSVLPDVALPSGELEYRLIGEIINSGRVVFTDSISPLHVQPLRFQALVLCFHSGRSFGGSLDLSPGRWRRHLRRLRGDLPTMVRESFSGRRRMNGGRVGVAVAPTIVALASANALGQLVGIATKSFGASRDALE